MPLVVPDLKTATGTSAGAGTSNNPTEIWTKLLVGKKLSDGGDTDDTTFAKKDLPGKHRVIEPGTMKTMDFVADRLNVHTDDKGIVKEVSHG